MSGYGADLTHRHKSSLKRQISVRKPQQTRFSPDILDTHSRKRTGVTNVNDGYTSFTGRCASKPGHLNGMQ